MLWPAASCQVYGQVAALQVAAVRAGAFLGEEVFADVRQVKPSRLDPILKNWSTGSLRNSARVQV